MLAELIIVAYRLLGNIFIWPLCLVLQRYPNFSSTILQRLAIDIAPAPEGKNVIWVHASSVGEVKAIEGLIHAIKKSWPQMHIYLSTMTATGRQVASKIEGVDRIFAFPFDLDWVMQRYMKIIKPSMLVIVETEIWPNLILAARRYGVPVFFVNARMRQESYNQYKLFTFALRKLLQDVHVLAIAGDDAQRFTKLGAGEVEVVGNLKFDAVGAADPDKAARTRKELGLDARPVFIAGSVREGEERFVVDAIAYACEHIPGLFSLVAPRHPESIDVITRALNEKSLSWEFKSSYERDNADVLVVDTVGELFDLYGASDVAFVGGSLIDLGGQNILEPVSWGVPTLHGPFMSNFNWALDAIQGNTVIVKTPQDLALLMVECFRNIDIYTQLGLKAQERLNTHRGITERYVHILQTQL